MEVKHVRVPKLQAVVSGHTPEAACVEWKLDGDKSENFPVYDVVVNGRANLAIDVSAFATRYCAPVWLVPVPARKEDSRCDDKVSPNNLREEYETFLYQKLVRHFLGQAVNMDEHATADQTLRNAAKRFAFESPVVVRVFEVDGNPHTGRNFGNLPWVFLQEPESPVKEVFLRVALKGLFPRPETDFADPEKATPRGGSMFSSFDGRNFPVSKAYLAAKEAFVKRVRGYQEGFGCSLASQHEKQWVGRYSHSATLARLSAEVGRAGLSATGALGLLWFSAPWRMQSTGRYDRTWAWAPTFYEEVGVPSVFKAKLLAEKAVELHKCQHHSYTEPVDGFEAICNHDVANYQQILASVRAEQDGASEVLACDGRGRH